MLSLERSQESFVDGLCQYGLFAQKLEYCLLRKEYTSLIESSLEYEKSERTQMAGVGRIVGRRGGEKVITKAHLHMKLSVKTVEKSSGDN